MGDPYVKLSDVMAALQNYPVYGEIVRGSLTALPVTQIPDPSLAVEFRYISANLLNALAQEFGHPPRDGLDSLNIGNVTFIKSVLNAPAPSVAAPTPNRTDIDWQTKITAAPLKLEAGKLYRTRDGRKAFVSIVKSDCNCAHGMVEEYYESITWCLDGRIYSDGKTAHIDLISLWDEPASESGTPTVSIHDPSAYALKSDCQCVGITTYNCKYPDCMAGKATTPESGNSKLLEMIDKAFYSSGTIEKSEIGIHPSKLYDFCVALCNHLNGGGDNGK